MCKIVATGAAERRSERHDLGPNALASGPLLPAPSTSPQTRRDNDPGRTPGGILA